MKFWKFALFGVTGDLAHRKILPAVSAFASKNINDVSIDLIGYSRSNPNTDTIESILNQSSVKEHHTFRSISYIQANYDDADAIESLITDKEEHHTLYIYLAVPPQVIIQFLQQAGDKIDDNTHIIIEKPFGTNSDEGDEIVHYLTQFDITSNVHFIDHYLFKSSVRFSETDKKNFKEVFSKKIKSIDIIAQEHIGVEDRKGYYNTTGAFKDMFIHLYSLLRISLELVDRNIDYYNILPEKITKGQYESYTDDIQDASPIDTYFKLSAKLRPASLKTVDRFKIDTTLESGKKLSEKSTQVTITFRDGSVLVWNINPEGKITYSNNESIVEITISNEGLTDHENMLSDLLEGTNEYFVSVEELLESWRVFDDSCLLSGCSKSPFIYKDGTYPPQKITS
jgi:glucose-6-phosphate 1-dehydrogenase